MDFISHHPLLFVFVAFIWLAIPKSSSIPKHIQCSVSIVIPSCSRLFLKMLINLLGQCADYGTFFLIGILSFLYHPLQLDIRWTFLVLFILHISRYTAMATMLDIVQWKRKKPLLKNTSEENILNLTFRGSVSLLLAMRLEGELIDTMGVRIIFCTLLLSVWASVANVLVGMTFPVCSSTITSMMCNIQLL